MRPNSLGTISLLVIISLTRGDHLLIADEQNLKDNASNTSQVAAESIPADRDNFHLFLLAGQSNMAGRGTVEPQDTVVHAKILSLNKQNEWVPAIDPLHFDKPKVAGVGIGRTFALDYAADHPGVTVGLIPCAAGGSPIAAWEPGGYHDQTNGHPYDDALQRVRIALKVGTLKGILWHQGESDSTPVRSVVYEEKLHAMINRLRESFESPDVPFLAGQLGQFADKPWNDSRKLVDGVHRSLPQKIGHCGFVESDGLGHRGDQTHFDSAALREFGHRYYRVFETMEKSKTQATDQ